MQVRTGIQQETARSDESRYGSSSNRSWSNYQARKGLTVPFAGEVAWMRPEGRKPHFIGTVTS